MTTTDSMRPDVLREEILKNLKTNVIEVCFRKVTDGNERNLVCTHMFGYIPETPGVNPQVHLDQEHAKPENQDRIVAWDVENSAWRSFYVREVRYVQQKDN